MATASDPRIVLVGGFPRAGTRQFCDIINASPRCSIQGEMNAPVFQKMVEFVEAVDLNHENRWMEKGYTARRKQAILETYRLFSKTNANRPVDWKGLSVAGFKKPLLEVSCEGLRTLFAPEVASLVEFYCLRNVSSNFNSLAGAFGYTTENYKSRIGASIEALQGMMEDDFFEVHPLFLDSFVSAEDKVSWCRDRIFEPMGLEVSAAEIAGYLERVGNRNRTPVEKRRPGITPKERADLFEDAGFVEKVEWLERRFGVTLLDPL